MSGELYVPVSITLPPEILALIDKIATEKKITRSELIRQAFGCYLQKLLSQAHPSEAGIYADKEGNPVHIGLLSDEGRAKVASGEWKLLKSF